MSYAGYGQSPYVPEPKVRFDAIGEAWAMTREKMGVWTVAILMYVGVILVMDAVLFGIFFGLGMAHIPSQSNPRTLDLPAQLVFQVIGLIVGAYFQAGLFRMALKQVRGQDIQTSDLFSAGDVVGPAIGTNLVVGIATYIGTLLCLIPGLIVSGRGMLAMPLTVDRGESGFGALQKSWEALKNDTLNSVLFIIVAGIVSGLGVLACGVGVLFTAPIAPLAIAIVYRDFFDTEMGLRGPTLDMPLPPTGYGIGTVPGQFGTTPAAAPGNMGDVPLAQNPPNAQGQMGQINL